MTNEELSKKILDKIEILLGDDVIDTEHVRERIEEVLDEQKFTCDDERIKSLYIDMLRTYNAQYGTLVTQVPFERNFSCTQGVLYATEHILERMEENFGCKCSYNWHKEWKDENFKK